MSNYLLQNKVNYIDVSNNTIYYLDTKILSQSTNHIVYYPNDIYTMNQYINKPKDIVFNGSYFGIITANPHRYCSTIIYNLKIPFVCSNTLSINDSCELHIYVDSDKKVYTYPLLDQYINTVNFTMVERVNKYIDTINVYCYSSANIKVAVTQRMLKSNCTTNTIVVL